MRIPDYIDLAIELYAKSLDSEVLLSEARQLIGGPFSDKQIEWITGVSSRRLANAYKDHARPGGRLNPVTLKAIRHLRYQADIGARLDKGLVWEVVLAGTSERVLARLIGKRPKDIQAYLAGEETHGEPTED